ncbi:transketolase [bacterium]|nr:transketolase [bacterium]
MNEKNFDFPHDKPPLELIENLKAKARQLRRDILVMLSKAQSGHTGGSLSAIDILTVLYYHVMKHKPENPSWPERDRFVLSKGHGAPALYAVLADCGYFPRDYLEKLRRLGSPLQGHPCVSTPGIEICTGSLGHGLSLANGMALGVRIDGLTSRIYALLGDGECQEGEVWEAAMSASHYKLSNLTAIVDKNGLQIDGSTAEVMNIDPIDEKFRAFGWHVLVIDGHDFSQLLSAFRFASEQRGCPTAIIARTVKGKGVSFMENNLEFHGRAPTDEELKWALAELQE